MSSALALVRDIVVAVPCGTDGGPYLCPFDEEFYALMEELKVVAVNAAAEGVDIRETHNWREAYGCGDVDYAVALWFASQWVQEMGVHPPNTSIFHCNGCKSLTDDKGNVCSIAYTDEACPF